MKLIINRIFICVTLLSISGLVFSSIYLPLERFLYRMVSAKFMVFINTLALFSFVLPFYYIVSLLEGSETAFVDYDAVVFDGKTIYDNVVADALTYQVYRYNMAHRSDDIPICKSCYVYLCHYQSEI